MGRYLKSLVLFVCVNAIRGILYLLQCMHSFFSSLRDGAQTWRIGVEIAAIVLLVCVVFKETLEMQIARRQHREWVIVLGRWFAALKLRIKPTAALRSYALGACFNGRPIFTAQMACARAEAADSADGPDRV